MKNLTPEGVVMLLRSLPRYDVDAELNNEESPTGLYVLIEDIHELIQQIRRTSANDPHIH